MSGSPKHALLSVDTHEGLPPAEASVQACEEQEMQESSPVSAAPPQRAVISPFSPAHQHTQTHTQHAQLPQHHTQYTHSQQYTQQQMLPSFESLASGNFPFAPNTAFPYALHPAIASAMTSHVTASTLSPSVYAQHAPVSAPFSMSATTHTHAHTHAQEPQPSPVVKPKKPRPPYFRFCMQRRAQLKSEHPQASFADLGRMLGEAWRALSEEEKEQFEAPMDDEGERDEREKLQRRGTSKDLLRAAQEHQYQLFLQQQQQLLQQQQQEQEPLLLLQQNTVLTESVQQRENELGTEDKENERESENELVLFTAPPPLNAVSSGSDSGLPSPTTAAAARDRRDKERAEEEREEEKRAPRIDTSVGVLELQCSSSASPSPASFSSVPSLQHMFRSSFAFAPSLSSPFPHAYAAHAEESADVRAQRIAHSQIMMGAHYSHPYAHAHAHPMMPLGGAPPAIPFAVPAVAAGAATSTAASSSAAAAASASAQSKGKKGKAAKRSILATVSEDQEKSSGRGGEGAASAAEREREVETGGESTPAKKKTKRRPSGFILFAREQRRHVVDQFPAATFSEIGKILGLLWAQQSREQKQVYVDAAKDWVLS